jgi:hypothetical protein
MTALLRFYLLGAAVFFAPHGEAGAASDPVAEPVKLEKAKRRKVARAPFPRKGYRRDEFAKDRTQINCSGLQATGGGWCSSIQDGMDHR